MIVLYNIAPARLLTVQLYLHTHRDLTYLKHGFPTYKYYVYYSYDNKCVPPRLLTWDVLIIYITHI